MIHWFRIDWMNGVWMFTEIKTKVKTFTYRATAAASASAAQQRFGFAFVVKSRAFLINIEKHTNENPY